MINKTERAKLFTALGEFIIEFRSYVISFLQERAGDEWVKDFERTLSDDQLRNWKKDLKRKIEPEELLDFSHLHSFAEEYKDLLKRDFPGKNQSLPTWLREVANVRHKLMHHNGVEEDEAAKTWIHLRTIAKCLGKDNLVNELSELEKLQVEANSSIAESEKIQDVRQFSAVETTKIETAAPPLKQKFVPVDSSSTETLDIVNCANADFRKTVLSHNVYLCPAKGGAYKHKQCKYLGVYWGKCVGKVAEIEAVVDVHSETNADIYFVNGNKDAEKYIAEATEKALQLRPNDLPIRVFLLENLHTTDFTKDSPGGMFGSKIYLNVGDLKVNNAKDLADRLRGKKYSEFLVNKKTIHQ